MSARENYRHLDELEAKYDDAKARSEETLAAKTAEQKRLEAEKAGSKRKKTCRNNPIQK